ncbi:sensor histidine kinase [Nonomuraea zeae]|uniref:Signal transduction histidine kinase subgroup 3 dimerisation and phosphoacceptor domain-containing protein n=1 Tax=Nonomuraea zeae TaxID=1642303 RepID=A0A5S4H1Z1_9ACTN|nr:histidine kinase [Nonomuraea zeae]TMR38711.1 hypothetical protein ETD85_03850 [Nonomuraea zeae]
MDPVKRARLLTRALLNLALVVMWSLVATRLAVSAGEGAAYWLTSLALIAAVCFTWLYVRIVNAVIERRYPTREMVWAGALAFLSAAAGGGDPIGWGLVPVTWLSIAVVGTTRRTAVLLSVAAFAGCVGLGALGLAAGGAVFSEMGLIFSLSLLAQAVVYGIFCVTLPLTNRLWAWMWVLAVQAHEGREAHTRLAVAEERLRFARDLHDLVGHQLSAIAVKTELAVRMSDVDAKAAKSEMSEVNALTRKALRELRQAVRGYRELDLTAELNSVKGVLEAAGVRCAVHLPYRDLPGEAAPVFAYAVREAVTNVLKHSEATFCDITLRFTDRQAELRVVNDGAARRQAADLGTGLAGMRERLAAVGGEVEARPTADGQFVLSAVVSLPIGG